MAKREDIEDYVNEAVAHWAAVPECHVTMSTAVETLWLDDLDMMEMGMEFEEYFSIRLNDFERIEFEKVSDIAALIEAEIKKQR